MSSSETTNGEEQRFRVGRRRFLSRSAFASSALVAAPSVVALTAPGCATLSHAMGAARAQALADRLDAGLDRIRSVPQGTLARQLTWHARPDIAEDVLRQTIESLVVADVARSIPDGTQAPRALAERLGAELPVVARAVDTHHALLSRMPGSARRRLDLRIRQEPEIPTEVADWIDRNAAELGAARESRLQLRLAARDVKVRLRRQSANAVIDDCVAKVERAASRSGGSLAVARSVRTSAMIDAIWQQVEGAPGSSGFGRSLSPPVVHLAPPPPSASPPMRSPQQDLEWARFTDTSDRFWSARWERPGDHEIIIGATMMPFGLASCGLMLIVGLIVLIAGAVQNASWDGTPDHG